MSGVKEYPVSLTNVERDRIMNSCRVAADQARANEYRIQQMQQAERELANRLATMDRKFEKEISGMSSEMQRIERAQNDKLRKQAQDFMNALSNQRGEILNVVDQQRKLIDAAMQNQRKELESQINSVREEISRKEQNQRKLAEIWVGDATAMLNNIDLEYRHSKFKPGGLDKLRQDLLLGANNIKAGVYQAAISTAQTVFMRGVDFKIDVMTAELEWEARLAAARQALVDARTACNIQENCRFTIETESGVVEVDGNIDNWTCGELTSLKEAIYQQALRIEKPDDLTTEQLTIISEQLSGMKERVDVLSQKAKEALIASQIRVTIADNILNALEGAGWRLDDSTYTGEDMRGSYNVKLTNGIGDEIVTVINPQKNADGSISNELMINFFDPSTNDEKLRSSQLRSISNALTNSGMECGAPQCKPGYEKRPSDNHKLRDFSAIRKEKQTGMESISVSKRF